MTEIPHSLVMQHHPGDDIGVFMAVCAAGSFAKAAPGLHLSASAVAKAIARLETRLQVGLLRRTTRRLSLTAEGEVYLDSCRRARAEIARAEAVIGGIASEPAGPLSVSLPPLFGTEIVAPALIALCESWPRLVLRLSTSVGHADLGAGGVDLAVRIGTLPDSAGLMARRLGEQDLVLCAASTYLETRPGEIRFEDLAAHDLIGSPGDGGGATPWPLRSETGALISWTPPARLLLEGSLLTLAAVRAGRGIGLLPGWLARGDIACGRLQPVLTARVAGSLPVHAVWPAAQVMLPRLRVAIDAVVAAATPALAA